MVRCEVPVVSGQYDRQTEDPDLLSGRAMQSEVGGLVEISPAFGTAEGQLVPTSESSRPSIVVWLGSALELTCQA